MEPTAVAESLKTVTQYLLTRTGCDDDRTRHLGRPAPVREWMARLGAVVIAPDAIRIAQGVA